MHGGMLVGCASAPPHSKPPHPSCNPSCSAVTTMGTAVGTASFSTSSAAAASVSAISNDVQVASNTKLCNSFQKSLFAISGKPFLCGPSHWHSPCTLFSLRPRHTHHCAAVASRQLSLQRLHSGFTPTALDRRTRDGEPQIRVCRRACVRGQPEAEGASTRPSGCIPGKRICDWLAWELDEKARTIVDLCHRLWVCRVVGWV